MSVHNGSEEMECQIPAGNEAVGVNAGEKACQVLIVDEWSILSVKIPTFQELNEIEHVTFGEVVGKGS